jgi:hypothetical protein
VMLLPAQTEVVEEVAVVEGWVVEGVVAVEADMRELEVVMNN